jgi:hypothetical protein
LPLIQEAQRYGIKGAAHGAEVAPVVPSNLPPLVDRQLLACHSHINLMMKTYTMLGVLDKAAGVEALPAIPVQDTCHRATA